MKPIQEIRKELLDEIETPRIKFIPRFICDHDQYTKGDMCYLCGTVAWKCEEDIKDKIHRNEIRRLEEIKRLRGE